MKFYLMNNFFFKECNKMFRVGRETENTGVIFFLA